MIALLDTSQNLDTCEAELGCKVQQLVTPLTRFTRQRTDQPFAIDNGAFSPPFNVDSFNSLLKRELPYRSQCLFVAVPDVVASARRTLECFREWQYKLSSWPIALVAQDGLEDLDIPWNCLSCVFIGGSTAWKMSSHAADVIKAGKILSKWVHVGRVNTPGRFEYFEELGADSIDGTGLSRYSWMRKRIFDAANQPTLFTEGAIQ